MAIVAEGAAAGGDWEYLGEVRMIADPDNAQAEIRIVVRSDLKGQGLGDRLLDKIIGYACNRGTGELIGLVRAENACMRALARKYAFKLDRSVGDGVVRIALDLAKGRKQAA